MANERRRGGGGRAARARRQDGAAARGGDLRRRRATPMRIPYYVFIHRTILGRARLRAVSFLVLYLRGKPRALTGVKLARTSRPAMRRFGTASTRPVFVARSDGSSRDEAAMQAKLKESWGLDGERARRARDDTRPSPSCAGGPSWRSSRRPEERTRDPARERGFHRRAGARSCAQGRPEGRELARRTCCQLERARARASAEKWRVATRRVQATGRTAIGEAARGGVARRRARAHLGGRHRPPPCADLIARATGTASRPTPRTDRVGLARPRPLGRSRPGVEHVVLSLSLSARTAGRGAPRAQAAAGFRTVERAISEARERRRRDTPCGSRRRRAGDDDGARTNSTTGPRWSPSATGRRATVGRGTAPRATDRPEARRRGGRPLATARTSSPMRGDDVGDGAAVAAPRARARARASPAGSLPRAASSTRRPTRGRSRRR